MIQVHHLTHFYGGFQAVSGLDFSVSQGELLGFIGPNGSGKTTTFKCLSTLLTPSSGEVIINGFHASKHPEGIRASIGFLPEENPLLQDLRVKEYLRFRFAMKKQSSKTGGTPEECMQICGLEEVSEKVIRNLSKGYKQRVGIAEALLTFPPVLFLDEPINGLDPDQIIHIRDLLRELKGKHTLIVSSHILSELELVCDRHLILFRGELKALGTMEELLAGSREPREIHVEFSIESGDLEEKLRRMSGVSHVKHRNGEYLLTLETRHSDPRAEINQLARGMNLDIRKIQIHSPGLESLYREITRE